MMRVSKMQERKETACGDDHNQWKRKRKKDQKILEYVHRSRKSIGGIESRMAETAGDDGPGMRLSLYSVSWSAMR